MNLMYRIHAFIEKFSSVDNYLNRPKFRKKQTQNRPNFHEKKKQTKTDQYSAKKQQTKLIANDINGAGQTDFQLFSK